MPGIFGCINRSNSPISEVTANEMANSLCHESWHVSKWILDACLLGVVELQPEKDFDILKEDEMSLIGVMRGCIYDKGKIRNLLNLESKSATLQDIRLIMHLYKKYGFDFPKYLNGLFSIALFDQEKDLLILVNDRYGFFPIFHSLNDQKFVFASEAKTIYKGSHITPSLDKSALPEFFSYSHLFGEKTFFEHVKYLPPATVLLYDRFKDEIQTNKYWRFSSHQHENEDLHSLLESFRELMKRAVERAVKDRKEVGVFLSGGLDSRILTAFACETGVNVKTFTFGSKNCKDQKIAQTVSQKLGVENIFLEIPADFIANFASKIVYQGDGLIRIRDCHFIALLEKVREIVDTVIMGTMGGDLFGYNITTLFRHEGKFDLSQEEIKEHIFKVQNRGLPHEAYQTAFDENFVLSASQMLRSNFDLAFGKIVENGDYRDVTDLVNLWDFLICEPRWIFQTFQFINWYVETKHPFLDNDFMDFFAFRLPLQLRLDKKFLKKAVNFCFPELSKIPLDTGAPPDGGRIRVLQGRLEKFTHRQFRKTLENLSGGKLSLRAYDYRDYGNWLRTDSKDYVSNILLSPEALGRNYFKEDFIKEVLDEHMRAKDDHNQLICDMVNFELTNRIFFDTRN